MGSVSLAEGPEAIQKKLRALQKKVRQIQQLKEKRDKEGESEAGRVCAVSWGVGSSGKEQAPAGTQLHTLFPPRTTHVHAMGTTARVLCTVICQIVRNSSGMSTWLSGW
jgi:hypothetical protein